MIPLTLYIYMFVYSRILQSKEIWQVWIKFVQNEKCIYNNPTFSRKGTLFMYTLFLVFLPDLHAGNISPMCYAQRDETALSAVGTLMATKFGFGAGDMEVQKKKWYKESYRNKETKYLIGRERNLWKLCKGVCRKLGNLNLYATDHQLSDAGSRVLPRLKECRSASWKPLRDCIVILSLLKIAK